MADILHAPTASPSTFPTSPLYTLASTPFAGRGVFATVSIKKGTLVLGTDILPAHMIYRAYRREVCAHCFAYDSSRAFKLRVSETGHSFCSRECLRKWKREQGDLGMECWSKMEEFVRGRVKEGTEDLPEEGAPRPSRLEIEEAWEKVRRAGEMIREARIVGGVMAGSRLSKAHRKAVRVAQTSQPFPDTLSFLISGILTLHRSSQNNTPGGGSGDDWLSILDLVADSTPYPSTQDLTRNTCSYLHLLSFLPTPLLTHMTPTSLLTLVSRDSHNSFGIRSLDDAGSEMFGYGVWPAASYFNHSCAPNVRKVRVGRAWKFWVGRDVGVGEELRISYMGGDEEVLGVGERRGRSEEIWGFVCACERCVEEDGDREDKESLGSASASASASSAGASMVDLIDGVCGL